MASSQVFLKDTDERACAYIAGPAPNRWGFTFEGKNLLESVINASAFGMFLVSKIVKLSQFTRSFCKNENYMCSCSRNMNCILVMNCSVTAVFFQHA